jgi:hypothetical protein
MKINILALSFSLLGLAYASPASLSKYKTTPITTTHTSSRSTSHTSTFSTSTSKTASTSKKASISKATATITPSSTSSTLASSTTAAPTSCSSIAAVLVGPGQPITYKQYFSGTGVTLDPNNPGNNYNSPITLSYGGTRCEAANHCANVGATANYYSFDLHYLKSQQQWQCVLYFEGNKDTAYFDVEDSNVGEVYGYTT